MLMSQTHAPKNTGNSFLPPANPRHTRGFVDAVIPPPPALGPPPFSLTDQPRLAAILTFRKRHHEGVWIFETVKYEPHADRRVGGPERGCHGVEIAGWPIPDEAGSVGSTGEDAGRLILLWRTRQGQGPWRRCDPLPPPHPLSLSLPPHTLIPRMLPVMHVPDEWCGAPNKR